METKNYINCIRTKKREAQFVAMRQALCYYLYSENIPCSIISDVMKITRRNVYLAIYKTRDLMEVGDKTAKAAYAEISNHSIRIVPCIADGNLLSAVVGYKLIIDNITL